MIVCYVTYGPDDGSWQEYSIVLACEVSDANHTDA